ncbi:MAG: energy-coupling factor ABC transporter ATP-binding protein [Propionibacteriaceae bacterium]|nr:energy-coupling factor ABC transporter ATP-binding protein [Propionibacteriaceae bacterium]
MIELRDVEVKVALFRAGRAAETKTLLHSVNLTLSEDRIAIIGANGSGKSTLLRLCNGLVLPSSGEVQVAGLSTSTQASQVRSLVGFIFTDPLAQLLMSTAIDDVELSLRKAIKDKKERHAKAWELLAARGLEHAGEQSLYDLSGGERQLVALTSVLATNPQILVADEPTTLLDLRNRNQVVRALWELPQQVIIATHDLDLAQQADRVIVIHQGQVACDQEPSVSISHYRNLMEST